MIDRLCNKCEKEKCGRQKRNKIKVEEGDVLKKDMDVMYEKKEQAPEKGNGRKIV
jgi:hypothetical protein